MSGSRDIEEQVAERISKLLREDWHGKVVKRFRIEIPADVRDYAQWGREGLLIPRRFSALIKDARYPLQIEIAFENGRALCVAVARLEATAHPVTGKPGTIRLDTGKRIEKGPPITGTILRQVPLDRIVREIADVAARQLRRVFDPLTGEERAVWMPAVASTEGQHALKRAQKRPTGRGAKLRDAELQEAADIYRAAFEHGDHPTEAVRKHFWLSRSSAGRWVAEARRRGFLPPTEPRRAKA
jgi:hypothetical protein